jgi:hypothetical protein
MDTMNGEKEGVRLPVEWECDPTTTTGRRTWTKEKRELWTTRSST